LSGNAANKLRWTGLTWDTRCKGLDATVAIREDSLTMGCRDAAGIGAGESGSTALRWGGLACGGLYRETTVACKLERRKF